MGGISMIVISLGRLPKISEKEEEFAELIINAMDEYNDCERYETVPDVERVIHCVMKTNFARVDWEEKAR